VTTLPDSSTLSYGYDGAVLTSVHSKFSEETLEDADVAVTGLAYHPSGGLEQATLSALHPSVASGKSTLASYGYRPSDHRLATATTTLDVGGADLVAQELVYDYDTAGNLLAANDASVDGLLQSFSYDALHRLATADGTGAPYTYGLLSFEYDRAGNLTSKGPAEGDYRIRLHYARTGGGPAGVSGVDLYYQESWYPWGSYSQDADGAVVERWVAFEADSDIWRTEEGRIRHVTLLNTANNHAYDLAGQRTVQNVTGWYGSIASERWYVDPSYEVDPVHGTHQVHVFVGSRRVATSKRPGLGIVAATSADAVEFYHADHVGSNTLVSNAAAEVVQRTILAPFGELAAVLDGNGTPIVPAASTSAYLFTDQERDPETGFHYFGARHYDPWIGRFLSQDPELIGPSAGITFGRLQADGQSLNPYAYVLNRPTRLVDPTGRFDIIYVSATSSTGDPVGPGGFQIIPGGVGGGSGGTGGEAGGGQGGGVGAGLGGGGGASLAAAALGGQAAGANAAAARPPIDPINQAGIEGANAIMKDIKDSGESGNTIAERSVGGTPGDLRPPEKSPDGNPDRSPGSRGGDTILVHPHPPRGPGSDAMNKRDFSRIGPDGKLGGDFKAIRASPGVSFFLITTDGALIRRDSIPRADGQGQIGSRQEVLPPGSFRFP